MSEISEIQAFWRQQAKSSHQTWRYMSKIFPTLLINYRWSKTLRKEEFIIENKLPIKTMHYNIIWHRYQILKAKYMYNSVMIPSSDLPLFLYPSQPFNHLAVSSIDKNGSPNIYRDSSQAGRRTIDLLAANWSDSDLPLRVKIKVMITDSS